MKFAYQPLFLVFTNDFKTFIVFVYATAYMSRKDEGKSPLIFELVDLAVLPAALLICAKAVGMAVINSVFNLNWGIQTIASAVFSVRAVYENASDALLVSSYTNLFMFISVFVGAIIIVSKSLLFHYRKASPHFVLKLAKYDLLHLLKSSFNLYKEAFVWGVFLILTTVYIFISFLFSQTYAWVAAISVMFCITFIWIMIQNIEEDILYHSYR